MDLKVAAMAQICHSHVEVVKCPEPFWEDKYKIADLVDRLLANPEVNLLLRRLLRLFLTPAQPAVARLSFLLHLLLPPVIVCLRAGGAHWAQS